LTLRADNADVRLTRKGYKIGSVSEDRIKILEEKEQEMSRVRNLLKERKFTPYFCKQNNIDMAQDGVKRSAFELLSYPHISLEQVIAFIPELAKESKEILNQIRIEAKYHKYLARQDDDIKLFQKNEQLKIPEWFDFSGVPSLSLEVREKLATFKPKNVSELSSISGVTPAAVTAILVHLTRKSYA
jgi:tRNA uridine 5-carboxymethylaminomethyl modification enzyme